MLQLVKMNRNKKCLNMWTVVNVQTDKIYKNNDTRPFDRGEGATNGIKSNTLIINE